MLGNNFVVEVDEPRWADFLEKLFFPFVIHEHCPSNQPFARISARGGGWTIHLSEGQPIQSFDPWGLAAYLKNVLSFHAIRQAEGIVGIHAAAVARNGKGVLLVGPAGAGKSSLTLRLLDNGWELLGDDVAPVTLDRGEIRCFPKPVSLKKPAVWDKFEHLWTTSAWLPPPRGILLIPASAFRCATANLSVVDFLLFPTFVPGASTQLQPLSRAETLSLCASNVVGSPLTPNGLRVLSANFSEARSARLSYGDSKEAIEVLLNDENFNLQGGAFVL